jgi:pyruvate, orthophosphate dikinase
VTQSPFARINQTSVGRLVKIACEKGSAIRSGIKLGICDEYGGDPDSVKFYYKVCLLSVNSGQGFLAKK